jgi:nicotinamidase-related amidase
MVRLPTRPDALDVALDRSAIVVVDMQNAFASKGGLLVVESFFGWTLEAKSLVDSLRR